MTNGFDLYYQAQYYRKLIIPVSNAKCTPKQLVDICSNND